jgi:hypothetical protein
MANTSPQTLPAFAPGQGIMLANDMAAGGFGNPTANLGWLNQVFQPAQTTNFNKAPPPVVPPVVPPGVPPTVTPKKPTTRVDRNNRSKSDM